MIGDIIRNFNFETELHFLNNCSVLNIPHYVLLRSVTNGLYETEDIVSDPACAFEAMVFEGITCNEHGSHGI
jgi:hypothetical protein